MTISEQILHPNGVEPVPAPVAPQPAPLAPEPVQVVAAAPVQVPAAEPPLTAISLLPLPEALPEEDVTFGCLVLRAGSCGWRAAKAALAALNSLRTLLFFGVSGALLLLAKFTDTNVATFISKALGGEISPEDLMLFMSVAGVVLRFITTTPVFERWRKSAKGGIVISEPDGGNVDEGEQ
jgi:hypothetical protein